MDSADSGKSESERSALAPRDDDDDEDDDDLLAHNGNFYKYCFLIRIILLNTIHTFAYS